MSNECKIKIEQRHIDSGIGNNSRQCPLALALSEKFPDKNICVGYVHIYINGEHIKHSNEVKNKIIDFDEFGTMTPFTVEIISTEDGSFLNLTQEGENIHGN